MRIILSLSTIAVFLIISQPSFAYTFLKYGNNNSVPCDYWCGAKYKGSPQLEGECIGAFAEDDPTVDCYGGRPGVRSVICKCQSYANWLIVKKGNNNSVSCNTFCKNPQMGTPKGVSGECYSAYAQLYSQQGTPTRSIEISCSGLPNAGITPVTCYCE